MPRFYFHILNDRNVADDLGLDLPSVDAAKEEALSFAGAIMRDEKPLHVWLGQPWRMVVTDSPLLNVGTTLFTLSVTGDS